MKLSNGLSRLYTLLMKSASPIIIMLALLAVSAGSAGAHGNSKAADIVAAGISVPATRSLTSSSDLMRYLNVSTDRSESRPVSRHRTGQKILILGGPEAIPM
ncbi:MAG: hypothetical protein KC777_24255 [Cyanobacteria bacterium HKST-UBA02]|nr:hypothetical protein [Cyanobacteria bacterium HKST-UBA02]